MKQLKIQYLKWIGHIWWNYLWFLLAGSIWILIAYYMRPSISSWLGYTLLAIEIILWIFRKLSQLQIHFNMLSFLRHSKSPITTHPLRSSLSIFKHAHKFMSAIGIGLLKVAYTFLWALPSFISFNIFLLTHTLSQLWIISALLAVIPIIKFYYTYVLAQYIYNDGNRADQMVMILNSVRLSSLLMKGHKLQLALIQAMVTAKVLGVSLIVGFLTYLATCITPSPWIYTEILAGLTFFTLMLFCAPYLKLLEFQFYQYLISQRAKNGSHLYQAIIKVS